MCYIKALRSSELGPRFGAYSHASGDGFRGSVHHLIDDLEDPRPRVDAGVFPGHGRRPRPIARLTEPRADPTARIASRSAGGVGSSVLRSMPTPNQATRALTSALSSVCPAATIGIPKLSACLTGPKPPLVRK